MRLCLLWLTSIAMGAYLLTQLRSLILSACRRQFVPKVVRGPAPRAVLPNVAIQIAVYREAPALPALLESIQTISWPRNALVVHVLDDSTGADANATAEAVAAFRSSGMDVRVLSRGHRGGFKAGALNGGLRHAAEHELIAYFDADCRPRSDFLRCAVPLFDDPGVAAVQCRWEFPNALQSRLTMIQSAAFEYLFRFELETRSLLDLPAYYLGSAAIWRRRAIESVGGFREQPFTAEDVDLGCRVATTGWKVLYSPHATSDDDALEDVLVFRAQQRRWARAVGRAGLDAVGGLAKFSSGGLRAIFDWTTLMPHISIPLALLATLLLGLQSLAGAPPPAAFDALAWLFALAMLVPPSAVAVALAVRNYHPADWVTRICKLLMAGPHLAATMTSFLFGAVDLLRSSRTEFVVTAKAGQSAMIGDRRDLWLKSFAAPLYFDIVVTLFLAVTVIAAVCQQRWSTVIPVTVLGTAYFCSLWISSAAFLRHLVEVRPDRR